MTHRRAARKALFFDEPDSAGRSVLGANALAHSLCFTGAQAYGLQDDGRVVIYDFGRVRQFDTKTVHAFASLVSAVRDDDLPEIAGALHALGARPPAVTDQLRKLLRGFLRPLLVPGARV